MGVAEVLAVIDAVRSVGCRFWLEGGWGVAALVGRQTRPHRDVDIDFDAGYEGEVLDVLSDLDYRVETDWRPNRVELCPREQVGRPSPAAGRRQRGCQTSRPGRRLA